jgi:hypothetical protein
MTAVVCLFTLAQVGCASAPERTLFTGRYAANTAASTLLPGDEPPKDFMFEIEDDGVTLATVQSFTSPSGEQVRLSWRGECDGRPREIEGTFVRMDMSCRRGDGVLVNTISLPRGTYTETCRLVSPRRLVCAGEMPAPGGPSQPFSYAFDRL